MVRNECHNNCYFVNARVDGSDDEELLFEKDPRFVVQIATTNNRKYFLLYINGQITNEVHYMPTSNLYAAFQPVRLKFLLIWLT